jgi:DNA-directed RNA polymerase subunit H (RpoH/RPB5)
MDWVQNHELTPPMRVLTEKEKKEFLKKYGIKEDEIFDKLPVVRLNDPIIRFLKEKKISVKPGDIIVFKRYDQFIDEEYYYWRVVSKK